MLNQNWVSVVASIIVANLNTSPDMLPLDQEDHIGQLIKKYEAEVAKALVVSEGWIALDGLPYESLTWDEVDADIIYAIKVSNKSNMPHNEDVKVTSVLPDGIILSLNDFDGSGPLKTSFEFSAGQSGLSLYEEGIEYSAGEGQDFAKLDGANIDSTIGAVRIRPKGQMAPNSSFTIKFKARIH